MSAPIDPLATARELAAAGIPMFVAHPGPTSTGFYLPNAWPEVARADPAVVDSWRPGMALCAVMGYGLDVVDLDPRNNGDGMPALPSELQPDVLGLSFTPSGGVHQFIRSLGVRKMGGVFPGIDVQAGVGGEGHGFVFLPPTAKVSKVDGLVKAYSWGITVDLGRWAAAAPHAPLAEHILAKKGVTTPRPSAAEGWMAEFASAQVGPQSEATADAAVQRELGNVTSWTQESGRDFRTTIVRAAYVLGGYVGAGHLTEEEADEELTTAAASVWGEANEDDLTWIRQGLADGRAKPFRVYAADEEPASAAPPQSWGTVDPATLLSTWNQVPLALRGENHQDYAEEVLRYAYPQYRAAVDTGGWVERGSDRWRLQPKDTYAQVIAGAVADNMEMGIKPEDPKDDGPGTYDWRMRRMMRTNGDSKGVGGIVSKMNAIARGPARRGWAAVRVDELDSEKEILWAGGTAWDLRASGVVPTPAALAGGPATVHLHTAKCEPRSDVSTPCWDAFLATVWPDPAIRAWALRVLGVALTGYADEVLPVLWGDERTGKSSVATLLMDLLGTYGFAADPRVLTGNYGHASVVFAFKGARMAYVDEGPSGSLDGIERLKQLTGGAPLTGNPMNGNPVSFSPTHTLVMTTNPPPKISDAALRARMRIIPCNGDQTAVRAAREALTPEVWEAEAPGVLAAFMREAAAWLADRGSARTDRGPVEVQVTEGEIAASQDHFSEWLGERTVHDETGTATTTLYAAFELWWEGKPSLRRSKVPEKLAFGHALKRLGVEKKDTASARGWKLRLITGSDSFRSPWTPGTASPAPYVPDTAPSPPSPSTPGFGDGQGTVSGGADVVTVMPSNPSSGPVLTKNMTVKTVKPSNKVNPEKSSDTPYDTPEEGGVGREGGKGATVTVTASPAPSAPEAPSVTESSPTSEVPKQLSRTAAAKARAAAKAEEKAAAKAQRIADAAGSVIGLPAAMRRGEEPRHITLDEAWVIVTECLHRTGGRLAVDVESSGRPMGHPDYVARTMQLGDDMEGIDLDLADADSRELARRACHEALELNAHNATADLAPLAFIDVVSYRAAMSKMVDTAILMKLSDPKDVGNEAGLKDLAPAILGVHALSPAADAAKAELFKAMGCLTEVKPETPLAKNGWAQVDSGCATMIRYAISDVLDCSAVRRVIPMPSNAVLERERRVQVVTSPSALVGVQLDSGRVREQIAERTPAVNELGRKLAAVGLENANSPKQVNEVFAKVGVQLPDTTKETLQKVTALHGNPAVRGLASTVLEYRKGSKFLSSFLKPWLEQCEHGDGIVRPTIYTLGADTGRMSCVRPNAQQLPKKGGARECWLAGEGMKIISGDFSSVEVRVIAALSQDPVLMRMLDQGLKLHDQIALQVFGPGYTETQRTWAKSGVFAHFFGAGIERIAITIQSTMEVAQAVVDAIAVVAPGVHKWTQQVQADVRAGMATFTTYSGRVIHLDPKRPYAGVNYMVQGTAREILADSLIKWDDGPYAGGLVIPVHDELLAWVPADIAEEASAYLEQCLTTELNGVRIMCEMDPPSDRWMSAKS